MATSQNGYSIDASLVASYTVPTSSVKLNLRKGDCSVLLLHFAAWYNRNIEPLKQAQCGGYNNRVIAGSKTKSNHASATAEDLNWTLHPQGKRNSHTPAQVKAINAQLAYYEGAIRWGNNYSTNPDPMHYEINKPPAFVKRIADKIRADNKPARVPVEMSLTVVIPQLKQGDDDNKLSGYNLIGRIQKITGAEPDGVWGPKTTAAIAKWMNEPASKCTVLNEHIYRNVFGAWSGK
jgi:hypothetical protein